MRIPLILFLVGLAVFAAFAGKRLLIHSPDNHFVYLADAFLHGSTELMRKPHHQNDWASYEVLQLKGASAAAHGAEVRGFFTRRKGAPDEFRLLSGQEIEIPRGDRGESTTRYFVSFPPAPAVLMIPFVAVAGYGANDVIFTVLFAALNGVLVFLLLQHLTRLGHSLRETRDNLWLTVLFTFGTAHLWCAVLGRVWFTALIVGVTFHLLYIYWSVDARRPLLAGIALAGAFSTRATLLFAVVFFYWQLFLSPAGRALERGERWKRFALFNAPCLVVGLLLLWYNAARFESPTEFGHTFLAGGTLTRIRDYGLFHWNFLDRNLHAALTLVPRIQDEWPYLLLSKHGMSMLLTTPALALLAWPRRSHPLARSLGWSALVVAVPIAFYQNTGWEQFSFRFALDFMPYLVCCLALGGRPMSRWFRGLIIAGVLVNALGAATFHRAGKLYGHHMAEEPQR
ncbi:MAG: hypothetical protein R3F65_08115 [bacterium]|nr:hypothetical protein [Myxococcales bacterium]MCB9553426.1 hypothetical protein [Myxococcales bacterium]